MMNDASPAKVLPAFVKSPAYTELHDLCRRSERLYCPIHLFTHIHTLMPTPPAAKFSGHFHTWGTEPVIFWPEVVRSTSAPCCSFKSNRTKVFQAVCFILFFLFSVWIAGIVQKYLWHVTHATPAEVRPVQLLTEERLSLDFYIFIETESADFLHEEPGWSTGAPLCSVSSANLFVLMPGSHEDLFL